MIMKIFAVGFILMLCCFTWIGLANNFVQIPIINGIPFIIVNFLINIIFHVYFFCTTP